MGEEGKRKVPNWCLDDITFSVMNDTVVLYQDRTIIPALFDYGTLETLPHRSFDTRPLRVEDLRPNLSLKAACEVFLKRMAGAPNIGWSNALPNSAGDVDFTENGEKFNFRGVHTTAIIGGLSLSKPTYYTNIGEEVVLATIQSYSQLSTLLTARNMRLYMSQQTTRFLQQPACKTISFNLTSLYADGNATTGTFTGYALQVDLDNGHSLDIQVNVEHVALNFAPLYFRWIGNMSRGLNGGDLMSDGVVLFKEFHLSGL